jgi:hypothetical protein
MMWSDPPPTGAERHAAAGDELLGASEEDAGPGHALLFTLTAYG